MSLNNIINTNNSKCQENHCHNYQRQQCTQCGVKFCYTCFYGNNLIQQNACMKCTVEKMKYKVVMKYLIKDFNQKFKCKVENNLTHYRIEDLKKYCKLNNIQGYSKYNKKDLVNFVKEWCVLNKELPTPTHSTYKTCQNCLKRTLQKTIYCRHCTDYYFDGDKNN